MRTGLRAALTAAFACLMLPAAQAGAVTPVVLIEDNNADLNTSSIQVDYEAEVASEDPGRVAALGEVDTNLQFMPPDTDLTRVKISSKRRRATFRFKTVGTAKSTQCALARGTATPKFTSCHSPKTFKHLKRGNYTFEVRAVGRAGPDATPAIRQFKIK